MGRYLLVLGLQDQLDGRVAVAGAERERVPLELDRRQSGQRHPAGGQARAALALEVAREVALEVALEVVGAAAIIIVAIIGFIGFVGFVGFVGDGRESDESDSTTEPGQYHRDGVSVRNLSELARV